VPWSVSNFPNSDLVSAKKRPAIIVLTMFCLILTGGCGSNISNTTKIVTFVDEKQGIEISFPENWRDTNTSNTPAVIVSRESPTDGWTKSKAFVTLGATDVKEGITAAKFSETILSSVATRVKNFEFVETLEVKIGEHNACKSTFTFEAKNVSKRVRHVLYAIVDGSDGFMITGGAADKDYDSFRRDIDLIVSTFKIKTTAIPATRLKGPE